MNFSFSSESSLGENLDKIIKSLLVEANVENEDDELFGNPFEDETDVQPPQNESDIAQDDPTETPAPEDLPSNSEGAYVSDDKLAMYAKTLLTAFMAPPGKNIPQNLLNVTRENANEVIQYIENALQLKQPTSTIANDISNI